MPIVERKATHHQRRLAGGDARAATSASSAAYIACDTKSCLETRARDASDSLDRHTTNEKEAHGQKSAHLENAKEGKAQVKPIMHDDINVFAFFRACAL